MCLSRSVRDSLLHACSDAAHSLSVLGPIFKDSFSSSHSINGALSIKFRLAGSHRAAKQLGELLGVRSVGAYSQCMREGQ
jgi:hypothetical protein